MFSPYILERGFVSFGYKQTKPYEYMNTLMFTNILDDLTLPTQGTNHNNTILYASWMFRNQTIQTGFERYHEKNWAWI